MAKSLVGFLLCIFGEDVLVHSLKDLFSIAPSLFLKRKSLAIELPYLVRAHGSVTACARRRRRCVDDNMRRRWGSTARLKEVGDRAFDSETLLS
jgi:hypothetical protein